MILVLLSGFFLVGCTNNVDQQTIERKQQDFLQQAKLEECLEKAEQQYNDNFEINSYPAPKEGFPNARNWKSNLFQEQITEQYNTDREICIKLYK